MVTSKYPKQIGTVKRPDITFSVENNLSYLKTEKDYENNAPLEIHDIFSRFTCTLIRKSDKTSVVANIPPRDIPLIFKKTEIMIEKKLDSKKENNEETTVSPAYTVVIRNGNFKGKTPAGILIENPSKENINLLYNQYNWLQEQLPKNPKYKEGNIAQMQAIADSLNLLKEGKLTSANVKEPIEIYDVPLKTPNSGKVNTNGLTKVYSVKITFDPTKISSPYYIKIMNCEAPPLVNKDMGADMSKAVNKKEIGLSMTESEWYAIIEKMKNQLESFENVLFYNQYNLANQMFEQNRQEALKRKNNFSA